ncbi:hypothetical protein GGU11DRAFT_749184 [Lentinula aff. detonsa]|uniref:Uncharacterized protein n=1 Tax=Lentinula aff. detonsa TaxID=2804958 RepID=A0AA38L5D7_9AGAR|nr:hypothetical protein GGU10DRAFT_151852 [Lentinula aff. detonsa]KAJ3793159.1 hypothetical protein GGU11DRAFT_749184 [Lentinula aff. detonsa]
MLHSFTSRFITILLLCNLAVVVIASPLVARAQQGWHVITLRRQLDGRKAPLSTSQPTADEKWSIYITSNKYLQARRQSDGQRWKGTGVLQQSPAIHSRRLLIIAHVKFATFAKQDAVLRELSTLEADSNLLYLIKVVTAIRKMALADGEILNPAEKRITMFRWRNKLTWEEKYWRMIETYADGFGGVVEGQGKAPYDVLLNARTKALMKGDNASTQNFT